jgi:hypothetical protein
MRVTETAGGDNYGNPFIGKVEHVVSIDVNIANLTDDEVDAQGRIKPGTPLAADGTTVGAAEAVYGVVIEAIKLTEGNDALRTGTFQIAVCTHGLINRDVCEDNLGRVLSANEIAGFGLSSGLTLTNT